MNVLRHGPHSQCCHGDGGCPWACMEGPGGVLWGGQGNKGSFAREEVGGSQKSEEARGAPPWTVCPSAQQRVSLLVPSTLSMAQRGQGSVGWWGWDRKAARRGAGRPKLALCKDTPFPETTVWQGLPASPGSLPLTRETWLPHGSGLGRSALPWGDPPHPPHPQRDPALPPALPGPGLPGFSGTLTHRLASPGSASSSRRARGLTLPWPPPHPGFLPLWPQRDRAMFIGGGGSLLHNLACVPSRGTCWAGVTAPL